MQALISNSPQRKACLIASLAWCCARSWVLLPDEVEHWSMTTLRDKLIYIGANLPGTVGALRSSFPRWRFHGGC